MILPSLAYAPPKPANRQIITFYHVQKYGKNIIKNAQDLCLQVSLFGQANPDVPET